MRPCDAHWNQVLKNFKESELIASQVVLTTIFKENKQFIRVFGNLIKLQIAIVQSGGCPMCFYQIHIKEDPIKAIKDKMGKLREKNAN